MGLQASSPIATLHSRAHTPAGPLYPEGPGRKTGGRVRVLTRARARAEAIHQKLVVAVANAANLDRPSSERTLLVAICMLCRRLSPETAHQITAPFPSRLQPFFDQCLEEPDRSLTTAASKKELGSAFAGNAAGDAAPSPGRPVGKVYCGA